MICKFVNTKDDFVMTWPGRGAVIGDALPLPPLVSWADVSRTPTPHCVHHCQVWVLLETSCEPGRHRLNLRRGGPGFWSCVLEWESIHCINQCIKIWTSQQSSGQWWLRSYGVHKAGRTHSKNNWSLKYFLSQSSPQNSEPFQTLLRCTLLFHSVTPEF